MASFEGRTVFYGAQAGDTSSGIISGDFNGDDAQDVVLGASLADGPADDRPEAGEVYFFPGPFGPGDTRDAGEDEQALTVYGANAGDQLGRAMAAGDVDGDGIDDILLGTPTADGPADDRPDAGEVHVVFGSPGLGVDSDELDLASESSDATIYGADSQDQAGYAVLAADISGDATDDIIVGALWADGPEDARTDSGEVYVVFGSPALAGAHDLDSTPPDITVYADTDNRLGEEVSTGDVNGDGGVDLVLPATFAPGLREGAAEAGQVHVILSPSAAVVDLAQAQGLAVYGVDAGDQFGHSLGTGDLNGDGFADILLAAVSSNGFENEARLAGEAALVLGRALPPGSPGAVDLSAPEMATLIYGGTSGDRLGRSAAVGDVNGDGSADLLIAAPGGDGDGEGRSNAGEVYVILGAPSLPAVIELGAGGSGTVIVGDDPDDIIGSESNGRPALSVHDVNDDSRADVLVSASHGDGPDGTRTDAGESYILFAAPIP
jgi:hypothetical protein